MDRYSAHLRLFGRALFSPDTYGAVAVLIAVLHWFPDVVPVRRCIEITKSMLGLQCTMLPVFLAVAIVPVALNTQEFVSHMVEKKLISSILGNWTVALMSLLTSIILDGVFLVFLWGCADTWNCPKIWLAFVLSGCVYAIGAVALVVLDGLRFVKTSFKKYSK